VSKKSDAAVKLLEKIQLRHPIPEPLEGYNLMHQGLYAILRRQLDHAHSVKVIELLKAGFVDWNELRVSQAQEIAVHLKPAGLGDKVIPVARDVREYLQEVFQRSHGLDLEFLRDDPVASARFISILPFIGTATASYLMWIASGEELPVTPTLVRVLDRIGLMSREGGSMKKARAAIEPLVPENDRLGFVVKFGEIASRWCDARKPACHSCVLVDDCRYGKKAYKEWKIQQERLEVMRQKDEARQAIIRQKEEERLARESAKAARKAAIEAARKAQEEARLAAIAAKKKAVEDERARVKREREAEIARRAAAKQAEIQRKIAAKEAHVREMAAKKLALEKQRAKDKADKEKARLAKIAKAAKDKAAAKAAALKAKAKKIAAQKAAAAKAAAAKVAAAKKAAAKAAAAKAAAKKKKGAKSKRKR
jgi:endonuclease III